MQIHHIARHNALTKGNNKTKCKLYINERLKYILYKEKKYIKEFI